MLPCQNAPPSFRAEPFHPGELEIQQLTGQRGMAIQTGRVIRDAVLPGAVPFILEQYMAVLGIVDSDGDPWAGIVLGRPGFAIASDDRRRLTLSLDDPRRTFAATPLPDALQPGRAVGTLFLDYATRRRLRANGSVLAFDGSRLVVGVNEAFPNCPKHIQRRDAHQLPDDGAPGCVRGGAGLPEFLWPVVDGADTLFVATAYDGRLDVSHRGGNPGFVWRIGERLRIPDYAGNAMFQTLGNLRLNPRAGLTVQRFDQNRQLLMTGEVEIELGDGAPADPATGGGRWWTFTPRRWLDVPLNLPMAWRLIEYSPMNPSP